MHRTGRVVARDVESFKVVVIVLHLGAFSDAVANPGEKLLDTLQRASHGMQAARGLTTTRQSYIDAFCGQLGR